MLVLRDSRQNKKIIKCYYKNIQEYEMLKNKFDVLNKNIEKA